MKQFDIQVYGGAEIPDHPMVGLLCSRKCPGRLILGTYDLVGLFRRLGVTVISGFPLVSDEVKIAAHNAFRNVEKGLVK
ncbi:MAG: hypothetical protein ACOX5G_11815 [Kiritimatiellia bacterium]|jgi:hypothetical protein